MAKLIEEQKALVKDILQGDISLINKKELNTSNEQLKLIADLIINNPNLTKENKVNLINNTWKLIYREKPPTIEEFLTPAWLGDTANGLYPHVKEVIIKYFDINNPFRHLYLSSIIGFGKEQPDSSKVMTPTGYRLLGDLKVGDYVANAKGSFSKILDIFLQGEKDVYQITFSDKSSTRCGIDHLWKTIRWSNKKRIEKVINTKELIDEFNRTKKPQISIPICKPINYEQKEHYIHPYILGSLINNSSLKNFDCIPKEYLYDSLENRIKLLQGLLGFINKDCSIVYKVLSDTLKDDVIELIQGLGGIVNVDKIDNEWVLYIILPIVILEAITEKKISNSIKHEKLLYRNIVSIEKLDYKESSRCLYLDDDDHLYLTDDYIVTHNSNITAICILYILTVHNLMHNPRKYYNKLENSSLVAGLGSFTLSKTKQVLLKPFLDIIRTSPKFKQVRIEDRLLPVQEDEIKKGTNRIVWTRASSMDSLVQLSNNLHIVCVSESTNMLGLNIICGALSELSFFVKRGVSLDAINDMVNELKGRIFNRFGNNFFARCIIDSSPYNWNSPIDKFVFSGEAEKDEKNLVIKGIKHWELEVFKKNYPLFYNENKSFRVFTGSAGKPTKIIDNIEEEKNYLPTEIVDMPLDLLELYKANPEKIIQDYVGIPKNEEDKLISDFSIIEKMFDDRLLNVIDSITAPANVRPEKLIWDKIKDIFFVKVNKEKYEFYRNPQEFRYIAVDQSIIDDTTGISMLHLEINNKGDIIVVIDFTIAIIPTKERINLDGIVEFILDLRNTGSIHIDTVLFDRFQSENGVQKLKREGFNVVYQSVDVSKAPYLTYISYMKNNRVKCGKNIFLKNNLKSLKEEEMKSKTKIQHTIGKSERLYNNNWETSLCGINNKDISDSVANAFYYAVNNYKNVPSYQYVELTNSVSQTKNKDLDDYLEKIRKEFNLSVI